mmetsp:Transcript_54125/g.162031  ORF Transcript_54125/g.162031 Transcript_54125/m.162031 type:complete len:146 (+) Transcript_54125:1841-2278(+)
MIAFPGMIGVGGSRFRGRFLCAAGALMLGLFFVMTVPARFCSACCREPSSTLAEARIPVDDLDFIDDRPHSPSSGPFRLFGETIRFGFGTRCLMGTPFLLNLFAVLLAFPANGAFLDPPFFLGGHIAELGRQFFGGDKSAGLDST